MPRLIVGAVYKHLGEKMELLWTEKLRLNTVHVEDVAAALWLLAECGAPGEVYNLVDEADSCRMHPGDAWYLSVSTCHRGTQR